MPRVLAIAESVEPVISMDTSIFRRASGSPVKVVRMGRARSQTASNRKASASTSRPGRDRGAAGWARSWAISGREVSRGPDGLVEQ